MYALQQNAMYCFKLIPVPPPSLGEKYTILNQSTLCRLPVLAWCQQPKRKPFISASKCGRGVWGMGVGKKGGGWGSWMHKNEKQTNKQTNKEENRMEWVKEKHPVSPISRSAGWAAPCKACPVFPVVYFFFLLVPLPMLGRFLSSLTYFIHRKAALPCAWRLRLWPWCTTLSVVPKAV